MSFTFQAGRLTSRLVALAKRHPLATFFLVATLALAPSTIHDTLYPPSPAELRARQEQASRDFQNQQIEQQKRTEASEQRKYLCRLVPICKHYASVRQECAVAGSYENCIRVKMGSADTDMIGACTEDGTVAFPPKDVPDSVECFFQNLSK